MLYTFATKIHFFLIKRNILPNVSAIFKDIPRSFIYILHTLHMRQTYGYLHFMENAEAFSTKRRSVLFEMSKRFWVVDNYVMGEGWFYYFLVFKLQKENTGLTSESRILYLHKIMYSTSKLLLSIYSLRPITFTIIILIFK